MMTSEVEERPRLVTGGYGRQWVKYNVENLCTYYQHNKITRRQILVDGSMFIIMIQESQKQLQMRRATSCFLLDVFLLDTSQDKTLVLEKRCIELEKILGIGLMHIAHEGTCSISVWPGCNVTTARVIKASNQRCCYRLD